MPYKIATKDFTEALHETIKTYTHAFYEVHAQLNSAPSSGSTRLLLPPRFGEGELKVRKMRDATFSSINMCFFDDVRLTETAQESAFCINVNLGVEVIYDVTDLHQDCRFPPRMISLGYSRRGEVYHTEIAKSDRVQSLSFFFSAEQLRQYLIEFDQSILIQQINKARQMQVFVQVLISARHQYLISRLVNNPYHGSLERLYFESVAGELLIALLEALCQKKPTSISLTPRDRELLEMARKLLLEDLQNPPTITQLAKSVGLNVDKLKKGFRTQFNTTMFKTLTEQRMREAAEKLRRRDISIAEIAYDSGYENVSKFIATFKKTYGVTPGMMRKEIAYSLPVRH